MYKKQYINIQKSSRMFHEAPTNLDNSHSVSALVAEGQAGCQASALGRGWLRIKGGKEELS